MIGLLTNIKIIVTGGAIIAAAAGLFYVNSLKSNLETMVERERIASDNAETYKLAAERAVQEAEELIRARDAAAADYRAAIDRISSAQDQCLDTRIPAELID